MTMLTFYVFLQHKVIIFEWTSLHAMPEHHIHNGTGEGSDRQADSISEFVMGPSTQILVTPLISQR